MPGAPLSVPSGRQRLPRGRRPRSRGRQHANATWLVVVRSARAHATPSSGRPGPKPTHALELEGDAVPERRQRLLVEASGSCRDPRRRTRRGRSSPLLSPLRVAAMILENGVIRTMDASLPMQRALAIAGERVAGGIGTHETALASPDVVDLGGRCVLPGFTDSHVHFPTWALALRQVRLEGTALAGGGARTRARRPPRPAATSCAASAGATPTGPSAPTKEALDAVTGERPGRALRPRLPLAVAQLRGARARRRRSRGGRRCRRAGRAAASRRASCARRPRGSSGTGYLDRARRRVRGRDARGACAWPPPAA